VVTNERAPCISTIFRYFIFMCLCMIIYLWV